MATGRGLGKPANWCVREQLPGAGPAAKRPLMAASQVRLQTVDLELPDLAATTTLAGRLAARLRRGDVIALGGDLGTGKTSFARALINALPRPGQAPGEIAPEEEVPSPTFTLVQTYRRLPADVWHFDLFRLERPEEAYELGIEEAFAEAISLIEWPERMGSLLPAERLDLVLGFTPQPEKRRATLTGRGGWAGRLAGLVSGDA
jgi:tRNA threonylcarbamoyladenosine biosynthesis protein TsaE